MVQQTAIEIVTVPLPFYDAFNSLPDVLFHAGGLGVQLTPLFNDGDLLLNLGDFPVAALVHELEVRLGDGAVEEFLQRPLLLLLLPFQLSVQPFQVSAAVIPAVLQNALHDAGEVSDDLFPVQLYGRHRAL